MPELKGEIEFRNVSFTYPDTGIEALSDVSFSIKEGESLAIIGTTGSGKSTIANLICRMYDVDQGQLLVDGHDIRQLNLESLRSRIGYVPQDVFLFSDTVRNNIAFGADSMTEQQIHQAADDADLLANIGSFKDGFDTRVGERGITLSGGQKQRVSIARAIAKEPSVLILDDSLSAVDTKTEHTILNSMKRIMKERSSIIISHRVSSAKLADYIIMLDGGKIVEEGKHDQLIKAFGPYRELYDKQLQVEEMSNNLP